jgi:hypothetical protein
VVGPSHISAPRLLVPGHAGRDPKSKYGWTSVPQTRRLKQLEEENARLKRLFADQALDNSILKDPRGNHADFSTYVPVGVVVDSVQEVPRPVVNG